ncbi:hypothetical protein GCK32_018883, partial [Trichostrongylus colubriformis]
HSINCTLVVQEACDHVFDVRYTEEDCNNGVQELRYYYDHETRICRQFFYGGCVGTSRNIFGDAETCEKLCANGQKAILIDSAADQVQTSLTPKGEMETGFSEPDHVSSDPLGLYPTPSQTPHASSGSWPALENERG